MKRRPVFPSRQTFGVCRLFVLAVLLQGIPAHPIAFQRYPQQSFQENLYGPASGTSSVPALSNFAKPVVEKAKTPHPVLFPYTVPIPWPTPFNGTNSAPVPKATPVPIPKIPVSPSDDTYPLYIPVPQFEYVPLYYNVPTPVSLPEVKPPIQKTSPTIKSPPPAEPCPPETWPPVQENDTEPRSSSSLPPEDVPKPRPPVPKHHKEPSAVFYPPNYQPELFPPVPTTFVEPYSLYFPPNHYVPGPSTHPETLVKPSAPCLTLPSPLEPLKEQEKISETCFLPFPPQPYEQYAPLISPTKPIPQFVGHPRPVNPPNLIHSQNNPDFYVPNPKHISAQHSEFLPDRTSQYPSFQHTQATTTHYGNGECYDSKACGLDPSTTSDDTPRTAYGYEMTHNYPVYYPPNPYHSRPLHFYTPQVERQTPYVADPPSFECAYKIAPYDTITKDSFHSFPSKISPNHPLPESSPSLIFEPIITHTQPSKEDSNNSCNDPSTTTTEDVPTWEQPSSAPPAIQGHPRPVYFYPPNLIHSQNNPDFYVPNPKHISAPHSEFLPDRTSQYPSFQHTRATTTHYGTGKCYDSKACGLDPSTTSDDTPRTAYGYEMTHNYPVYYPPNPYHSSPLHFYTPQVERQTPYVADPPSFECAYKIAPYDTITKDSFHSFPSKVSPNHPPPESSPSLIFEPIITQTQPSKEDSNNSCNDPSTTTTEDAPTSEQPSSAPPAEQPILIGDRSSMFANPNPGGEEVIGYVDYGPEYSTIKQEDEGQGEYVIYQPETVTIYETQQNPTS